MSEWMCGLFEGYEVYFVLFGVCIGGIDMQRAVIRIDILITYFYDRK